MELTGTAESTISWLTIIARVCVNIFEHGCVCANANAFTQLRVSVGICVYVLMSQLVTKTDYFNMRVSFVL